MYRRIGTRAGLLALIGTLIAAGAGCAHVNRDELTTGLDAVRDELRAEQQAQADELGGEIDMVNARVDDIDRRQSATAERVELLEQSLRELETELGATIERFEDTLAFSIPLFFEFDSATLGEEQMSALDRFASVYGEFYEGNVLTVEGFTDEAGSEAYNQLLGMRRAEGVKGYLTEIAGLSERHVRTVSYGESRERLVAPGEYGPSNGRENRRVVLVIDGVAATPPAVTEVGGR